MKKSMIKLILACILIASLLASTVIMLTGCNDDSTPPTPPATGTQPTGDGPDPGQDFPVRHRDYILFGGARAQSGGFVVFDQSAFGPSFRLWVDEVNARGGLYLSNYGRHFPIEVLMYDCTSDLGTMIMLYERLIVEDQVCFIVPPIGTGFVFALAPLANQYGYMFITGEGGGLSLVELLEGGDLPYVWFSLNFSETQVPALTEILVEHGIENAFVMYVEDLHGAEYRNATFRYFEAAGIEILGTQAIPVGITDLTPVINTAMALEAQAFLSFAYTAQNHLAATQSMALGYNPDVFLIGPGGQFEHIANLYGGWEYVEGIMSYGGWNERTSPEAADFLERLLAHNVGNPHHYVDWQGGLVFYAVLEYLAQAIEAAGTTDNAAVRAIYESGAVFETVLGPTWYEGQRLAREAFPGNISQWQNGRYEVIDTSHRRTADPIIPKPRWPGQ